MSLNNLPPELKLTILSAAIDLDVPTLLNLASVNRSYHLLLKCSEKSFVLAALTNELSICVPVRWLLVVLAVNRATYNASTSICTPLTGTKAAEVIDEVLEYDVQPSRDLYIPLRNLHDALRYEISQPDGPELIEEVLVMVVLKHCRVGWDDGERRVPGYLDLRRSMGRLWTRRYQKQSWFSWFHRYIASNNRFRGWASTPAVQPEVLKRWEREKPPSWWFKWWLFGMGDKEDGERFGAGRVPRRWLVKEIEQLEVEEGEIKREQRQDRVEEEENEFRAVDEAVLGIGRASESFQ